MLHSEQQTQSITQGNMLIQKKLSSNFQELAAPHYGREVYAS